MQAQNKLLQIKARPGELWLCSRKSLARKRGPRQSRKMLKNVKKGAGNARRKAHARAGRVLRFGAPSDGGEVLVVVRRQHVQDNDGGVILETAMRPLDCLDQLVRGLLQEGGAIAQHSIAGNESWLYTMHGLMPFADSGLMPGAARHDMSRKGSR